MSESEHGLAGRFLRGLAISPDRCAIRTPGRSLEYAQAHRLALTWAGSLLRACDEPPKAIGVLAAKGVESYVGILTALYCGVPAVPLHPDFPIARTRQMIRAANVSALVTDERGYRLLPDLFDTGRMPVLLAGPERGAGAGSAIGVQPRFALAEPRRVHPLDVAYILFTSGSTGRPKGMLITHANLGHYFRELDARYRFGPDDVFSQVFEPACDCTIFDLFGAWGAGGTLVSVPPRAYGAMTDFVTAEGITAWYSTPAAISVVARRGGLGPGSLPTLRVSMFAGDALKASDAAAWQAAASESVVDNLYGPAETTVTCTAYRWSQESSAGQSVNGIVPIGTMHGKHEYLLLDADGEESAVEGELCVSGPQVTPGYLDPEDNREQFFTRRSRRWYRTGDRMRRAENGDLKFLGRVDNQVQIQGWRIELAEIDHCVRRCRGVRDAATVAATIDGRLQLVVFYTGAPTTAAEFTRQLLKMLPQPMLPRHFKHLDEMPLSVNRKIDRQAMKQQALELFGREKAVASGRLRGQDDSYSVSGIAGPRRCLHAASGRCS